MTSYSPPFPDILIHREAGCHCGPLGRPAEFLPLQAGFTRARVLAGNAGVARRRNLCRLQPPAGMWFSESWEMYLQNVPENLGPRDSSDSNGCHQTPASNAPADVLTHFCIRPLPPAPRGSRLPHVGLGSVLWGPRCLLSHRSRRPSFPGPAPSWEPTATPRLLFFIL